MTMTVPCQIPPAYLTLNLNSKYDNDGDMPDTSSIPPAHLALNLSSKYDNAI